MVKNIVIGLLALLSLFLFLYGLTQQLKAENYRKHSIKIEQEALREKEILQAAVEQAQRKAELARLELERVTKSK